VHEDRIAAGLIPATEDQQPWRNFVDTMQDYLAYGEAQGGRGGRPWGHTHARNQRARLAWWHEQIGFDTPEDLMNALRPVEAALVRLRDRGRTGKTLRNYQESLQSFCRWCVDRGYLPADPLARLRKFDASPRTRRRALTLPDIAAIMAVAAPERRLLYEMALFSGLRLGELRHLKGAHLDIERGGVRLEAEWTKNRRAGFQPLPAHLVARLARATEFPSSPLLRAPSQPQLTRLFDRDLQAAGIEKVNQQGVVVFHSWRGTYGTLLDSLGASPKETQELMRHATPMLTMQRYVQARLEWQKRLVQNMAELVRSARGECADRGRWDKHLAFQGVLRREASGECGIRT
jgi:integrase